MTRYGMGAALLLAALLRGQTPPAQDASGLEAVVETEAGTIRFEFAPERAPKHVEQFLKLTREGYYNGSAFFRVVANGIVQGGDPLLKNPNTPRNQWGTGGLSLLASEFNDIKHAAGTVSTVRLPDRADSDGAQFFICVSPQPALDGKYTAFGKVTEGLEVAAKISQMPADAAGLTARPVRILKITLEPKKTAPFAGVPAEQLRRSVTMETTPGTLKIRMEPEWAPENVRQFLTLAETGWYDGTAFHRIERGFVAQGGTAETRSSGAHHAADRWVHAVKGEFRPEVKHVRGIVSMAHGEDPDSATTSFFLVLARRRTWMGSIPRLRE